MPRIKCPHCGEEHEIEPEAIISNNSGVVSIELDAITGVSLTDLHTWYECGHGGLLVPFVGYDPDAAKRNPDVIPDVVVDGK